MRIGMLLFLAFAVFLSALPTYYGAKRYCETQSKVELYAIVIGGGVLVMIVLSVLLGAMNGQITTAQDPPPAPEPQPNN